MLSVVRCLCAVFALFLLWLPPAAQAGAESYTIVDTGQVKCYNNTREITWPSMDQPFYGQDAQYQGNQPAYRDNGDGTITDLNTGLMWVKARGSKVSWHEAVAGAAPCRVGGYHDWRMPTIKELYSLINFTGYCRGRAASSTPYIDTKYFGFVYGNVWAGARLIDCQDWSATQYVGAPLLGSRLVFGVNFADGRIKGYPKIRPGPGRGPTRHYVRYVRGNPNYGKNDFHDNGDGTVTDRATGLMWSKTDSGRGLNWQEALAWVQARNRENFLGHHDWRLPNAKELQSLVDYTRAPEAADPSQRGPAIDPIFQISRLYNGEFPYFWTSTTHLDGPSGVQYTRAVYVAFGRALGYLRVPPFSRHYLLLDVHGAGAQRSDPKSGNPAAYPFGHGPQGDVIRIDNYVRLVRGGQAKLLSAPPATSPPCQSREAEPGRHRTAMGQMQ